VRLAPTLGWRVTLSVLDFATVFLAASLSYGVYLISGLGLQHYEPALYANLNLVLAAVTVFSLHGSGAYRDQMGLLRIEAVRRILYAVGTGILLLIAISYLVKFIGFSRLHVLISGPVVVVALVVQRLVVWAVADKLLTKRSTPVVVYGTGETGRVLAQQLLTDHTLGLQPVGFIDDDQHRAGEQIRVGAGIEGRRLPILGTGRQLKETIERVGATAVFLAIPSASADRIPEVVTEVESCGVPFFVAPSAGDLVYAGMQFGQVGSIPVFTPRRPSRDRFYDFSKRLIDLAVASALLLVTSPVLLVAGLLVRWSSPGPVLFTQSRAGRGGEPFTIFKLRTMYTDAPRYARHPKHAKDGRITPIGRWLRRTSIDELPQLWNVLRGEMSLVGPRPEMPFVAADYDAIQRQRLTVKPGVTGLWQISADRAFSIHDNIHYDLYYVENRCLAIDLSILLSTPFALLGRNRTA
jgi:exopolysaccharide biosynthesis polyprenyl glycosylphosphotransferase